MQRASAAVLVLPDALGSSVTLPLEMLQAAADHRRARRRPIAGDIRIAGLSRSAVTMTGGIRLTPTDRFDQISDCRLLIVPGFWRHPERHIHRYPALLDWLRALDSRGATLCAVGSGSYLLAAAGVLDNRAGTTHWHHMDDFARRFPAVHLKRDFLITESDNVYCAGSVNAVADVIVHLIREQVEEMTARAVESQFSPEVRRQFDARAWRDGKRSTHTDETIARLQDWLAEHYPQPLTLDALCRNSGLNQRTLCRRFVAATGSPPMQYVQQLRINAAVDLLRDTDLSIAEIADASGFGDSTRLCRGFRRARGQTPGEYRKVVRAKLFSIN